MGHVRNFEDGVLPRGYVTAILSFLTEMASIKLLSHIQETLMSI
jgi:hypothetical protein